MRSDSRPNKRKVGTRSSKATSSSMDIRGDRESLIYEFHNPESYHGTSL